MLTLTKMVKKSMQDYTLVKSNLRGYELGYIMTQEIKQRIEQLRLNKTPDGYKKTAVGVIPQDWEVINLSDISEYKTKKNVENIKYPTFTNSATEGIIKQTDYFDKEISNDENISGYYLVNENDFVYNPRISVSAPCGPINCSHIPETGIMSPLYTVFKLLKEKEFYEFFFHSSIWYKYMCSVANYGARSDRMNITNNDFFKMPLCQPPLAEQQKIAEILSTQDKVIELQQKRIDELKKLKKAYLSKMFPQKGSNVPELRFKGFTGNWEQHKCCELCSISTGKSNTQDNVPDGEYPFYVRSPIIERSNKYLYDEEAVLTVGDGVGTGKVYHYVNGKYDLHQRVYRMFNFDKSISAKYFYYYFSNHFYERVMMMTAKTSVDSVRLDMIADMNIHFPKIAEQQKIGSFFRTLDNIITLQSRKLDAEKLKKKSLMQLLLTGIVRVK